MTNIKFSNIENVTTKAFLSLFQQPQAKLIQKIHLKACDGINNIVIKTIAENCPNLLKLAVHELKSTDNSITSNDILLLAIKCPKLEFLDLCYTHKSIGKCMVQIISQMPALRHFEYCIDGNWGDKEILTGIYNHLCMNLKNFNVVTKVNVHLDRCIVGTRIENFDSKFTKSEG